MLDEDAMIEDNAAARALVAASQARMDDATKRAWIAAQTTARAAQVAGGEDDGEAFDEALPSQYKSRLDAAEAALRQARLACKAGPRNCSRQMTNCWVGREVQETEATCFYVPPGADAEETAKTLGDLLLLVDNSVAQHSFPLFLKTQHSTSQVDEKAFGVPIEDRDLELNDAGATTQSCAEKLSQATVDWEWGTGIKFPDCAIPYLPKSADHNRRQSERAVQYQPLEKESLDRLDTRGLLHQTP
mmetsp:Transcript_22250/g.71707  ORF Transcript_22250/g.71707 Transcript_22250/m.71707 type:complete len:245 (+) Transcript_22250:488-1222(+)